MINVWESLDSAHEARTFCDIHGITTPVLIDESGQLIEQMQVRGVPFNLVVDESGTVVGAGLTHPDELVELLESTGMLSLGP